MSVTHHHHFKKTDFTLPSNAKNKELTSKALSFKEFLKEQRHVSKIAYLAMPDINHHLSAIKTRGNHIKSSFTHVVLLGTGGSSLGAQTLIGLKKILIHDHNEVQVHVPDNFSPYNMAQIIERTDKHKTHYVVVSKSGGTSETLAQFLICLKRYDNSDHLSDHFTIITEPGDGALRQMAEEKDLPILDHPKNLGGRYSVMSAVGLLPAYIAGLNIDKILDGARDYLDHFFDDQTNEDHPVIMGAIMAHYLQTKENKNISFMMPYDHHLHFFGQWYQQLWAESLGKNGMGQTPVRALGPLDQHSQLQLLIDGPDDKFITIITEDCRGKGPLIAADNDLQEPLTYLNNRTVGDVVFAEAEATLKVLKDKGLAIRHIHYDHLNEYVLGELLMHFMLETSMTANLMGVNPYDQPAVETGKHLTRQYLSKM